MITEAIVRDRVLNNSFRFVFRQDEHDLQDM